VTATDRGPAAPLRVVIAEDNYLVREGLRRLLEAGGEVEVVAAVADGADLLDAVGRLTPDAALIDIRMPPTHRMEGIDAAHAIRARDSGIGIVILSQHADELLELLRDGTSGYAYLLKERVGDRTELLRALRETVAGRSVIDPLLVEPLVGRRRNQPASVLEQLTERELEVLGEMAQGKTNAAIARSLSLSESSVEKHSSAIFSKLGLAEEPAVHRRVAAVLTFLRESVRGQSAHEGARQGGSRAAE
jgi:DNA-binding NarL/FixJ family response regulator